MIRNKITIKLFFISSVLLLMFISIILLLQSLFFEKYYISKKVDMFTSNFNNLSSHYKNQRADEEIKRVIDSFDETNGTKTLIFNLSKYKESSDKTMETSNQSKEPNINNENSKVEQKDSSATFFTINGDKFFATASIIMRDWISNKNNYRKIINSNGPIIETPNAGKGETRMINGVSHIKSDREDIVIFSVMSLQPVGDAVSISREFYVYLYGGAIFIIIILAFIFTFMITKPLLNLMKAATKMAELDFTAKCEIKSKDEIGKLGEILNFLSDRLGNTLFELKNANERLREDIEKEKQLEIMRREFVAGVSHELKAPISIITGYTEALKDNMAKEENREFFLDVILDESRKMDILVKEMLDLSLLESGKYILNKEKFNIVELINQVITRFSKKISDKNIELRFNKQSDTTKVYADIFRIDQVITNILSNAIKYVPEGGNIYIVVKEHENNVIIEIENKGEGILPEDMEKIWDRFYKADKSRNREIEGTGIGLSITKNILLLHESRFGVDNTEQGVKFFFELPTVDNII